MAEAVLGATIQVLLEHLITISNEQIGLVRDFKKDLENLKNSFEIVKAFLHDAEKKQVNNDAVRIWLRNLENLAFEADNVFDDIGYQLLSRRVGATRNKTGMKKVLSYFSIAHRLQLGRRIKNINDRLGSINQLATQLGLHTGIANAQPPVPEIPETDSFSADPVYGREYDVSMIVEKLTTAAPSPGNQVLSVLPIVGMGGLGKTTLARKVFHHEQIISHFGSNRVWVHVPRNFDVPNILKKILMSLTNEKVELETREALMKKLQQHLRTGRYLLVLDDVWDEDENKWENFVKSLSGISSAPGNCIIVTTRSQKVVSIVRTLQKYELGCLSGDDCWSIIKAKAFIDSRDVPMEFELVGRNIAIRCCGSPLAAKVVGGLLRDKSKDEWQNIEMNRLPDFGDDQNTISKILKLSFDYLSSPSLKKCFAYCSIFPKGYQIEKQQLIQLWMGEGFLQTDHHGSNINMETTGSKNFDILMWNSLLQVADRDNYGNVTHCNMHDLVHDLANSVVCENGLLQSRRYIGYESSGDGLLSIPKGQERYVRTLFFRGKVSDIMFSKFESLHNLTLVSEEDIDQLPTSIRKLKHLRYLDISETRIRYLPDSVGELYHLQTLRAKNKCGHSHLEKLSDSLSYLINLRHLHIPSSTALPPEIGKLTSLQALRYIHVGGENGCGISELGNLKYLKRKLEIRNLENVRDKNEAMSANLSGKKGVYKLKLVWDEFREGGEANDESVLEGLKPHPNLKRLKICGFKGKSLSLWEELNNLEEINLVKCTECEELPMLGQLPRLKSLCLDGLINVKYIRSSFYGNIVNCRQDTVVVFPALERIELENMSNLKEWDEVDLPSPIQVFPRLKYLNIYKCQQLTRAPSHFPCLEELEINGMERSLALENICGIKLNTLTRLTIKYIERLECLPHWVFSNNHNLTKLNIIGCPDMTHLVPHLGGCGAPFLLRELRIFDCSSLRELPDDLHCLDALEELEIYDCPDLKSIRHLTLFGMENWDCLPDQLQHLTSLEVLWLYDFGIEALPEWFGNLSSLKKLELKNCKRLRHLPSKQAMQRLSKLHFLYIKKCPLLLKDNNNNNNNNEVPQIDDSEWPKISHIPRIYVDYRRISSDGH